MVNNAVITQLRRKESTGFTTTPIGAELKYVGAQQNSNTHNLEEQLILGTDKQTTITDTVPEGENYLQRVEQTKYKTNASNANYYILNKTTQMELGAEFDENDNKLTLNLNPKTLSENETLTFYVNEGTTVSSSTKTGTYTYNNNIATVSEEIAEST